MKTLSLRMISRVLTLLAVFVLLITSCTLGDTAATSSGSLRAWIDQPADGYTLPLAPYTIVAHARQDGGGVKEIQFMVNGTLLGTAPTNVGEELTSASQEWNPSAPGEYRIQAIALNNAGQQAFSEVSFICISQDPNGDCTGAAGTGETTSGAVDTTITLGGAPNPASIGASCNPVDRVVTFEAFILDASGAIEIYIEGNLVGASGERLAFTVLLSPGITVGSYIGTLDLSTMYDGILGGADGTLEYHVALMNKDKEFFKISKTQTIAVRYCGGVTPLQGIVKVGAEPDWVFKGKCPPSDSTTINIEAGTDIDPGMFDHIDLGYAWFDDAGNWLGTVGVENRAEMTPEAGGGYWYHLDANTAPASMGASGQIKFRAIVVNTDNVDVAYSDVVTIVIKDCGGIPPQQGVTPNVPPVPASCTSYTKNPDGCKTAGCYYWSDSTCSENPEQAPPPPVSCSSYTKKSTCKAAGCYYWSDGTCSENQEPAPPPSASCSDYTKNPDGCKNLGCYYWSDNTCSQNPEPAPQPSCSDYNKNPDGCKAAGCNFWSDGYTCSEKPE
jgi:hypothetical protein